MKSQLYYKRLLSKGLMYVEFIKKDGTLRKMWCTRDNNIVKASGHELIQFNQVDIIRRENRFKNHVFVYDLQEKDTRILNIQTINEDSIDLFECIEEANIPDILNRFTKKELGIVEEEVIEPEEVVLSESELKESKPLEENLLGISENEIDDIFK